MESEQPYLGDLLTMLINHLQVLGWSPPMTHVYLFGLEEFGPSALEVEDLHKVTRNPPITPVK